MTIAESLKEIESKKVASIPTIFDLSKAEDKNKVEDLIKSGEIKFVCDDFEEQHLELFGIKNPSLVYTPDFKNLFKKYYSDLQANAPLGQHGRWVFFPWLSKLVHVLDEEDFHLVRTARNQNLITKEEQQKFYNTTIGIGGLSVGSSVAFAIVLQGGAKHIKLADMDRLALTNTNRILSGVDNLGVLKVEMAARMIYEINPYAQVDVFAEGLNDETLPKFFDGLDIVIDELDNLAVKYRIREFAKKHRLPVLMAADNGDNAVVDIERYDLDANISFFHDRMGEVSHEALLRLDKFGIGKLITKLVGPENVTARMQASLLEMGKTIVSWPQLGGAAMINGAAVAYCARKIAIGEPLGSNRALIVLDEKLIPNYDSIEEVQKRQQITNNFRKKFDL